jgi:hypothetical protein
MTTAPDRDFFWRDAGKMRRAAAKYIAQPSFSGTNSTGHGFVQ